MKRERERCDDEQTHDEMKEKETQIFRARHHEQCRLREKIKICSLHPAKSSR
jgi:hypothetical protein